MIRLPFAVGKTYGVVGLGKSGRAAVASLIASGARVIAWDDGEASRKAVAAEFPTIEIAEVRGWDFAGMASLILSPGIVLTHPAVVAAKAAGVEVIGDVELLYRAQPDAWYVGITGTNGKSTTTTLIAHILKACGKRVEVGGNLGTPALALAPLGVDGIYVLELSSYQLDLVATTRFDVAVLLNISPDHLDHHGSMEHYIAAKLHLFDRMRGDSTAIIGTDDAVSARIGFSMLEEQQTRVVLISAKNLLPLDGVKSLQGAHNAQNAAAAYAACVAVGCEHAQIMAAMRSYPGLDHRMQWLGEIGGVAYVNDSKATNADAAEKALLTYDRIHWIIGGVAKEGGIEPLAKYFGKIRHAYLIGEAAADFARTLEGKVEYTQCGTLSAAFAAASMHARAGEAVVLSPACASFDQYPNFEVRGAAFVTLFEQLKAGGTHGAATA